VCPQDHVAGMIADGNIRVGGTIVEELSEGLQGGLCSLGLLCGECAKGSQQCGVDSLDIVQEDANDFLDALVVSCVQDGCVIGVRCELGSSTIGGFCQACGACSGCLGCGCQKHFKAHSMYPGMARSMVCWA